ncbi:hypothetical protein GDO81_017543, partial [Engystomops pustulosus]
GNPDSDAADEFTRKIQQMAEGRQIEYIDIEKPAVGGLGFSVVALKNPSVGDVGVFIKGVQAGSLAERDEHINDVIGLGVGIVGGESQGCNDGRLKAGDHILQIGDTNVQGMASDQVAQVLKNCGNSVRMVVARDPVSKVSAVKPPAPAMLPVGSLPPLDVKRNNAENPENDTYDITLTKKEGQSLGITVVGYTGGSSGGSSGIYVKGIIPGSAADQSGCIQVHDRIVAVDGDNIQGLTNQEVVTALRNTGQTVNRVQMYGKTRREAISFLKEAPPPFTLVCCRRLVDDENDNFLDEPAELLVQTDRDPLDPARTVIVVQSLLAGGVAEESGQILPGDRLVFVNDSFMDNASLEEAVQILTSVPPGRVRIGICKPLVEKYQVESFLDEGREDLVDEPSLALPPAFTIPHDNNPEHLQESWEMQEMGGFTEEREMLVDEEEEDPQQEASQPDSDGYSPPPSARDPSSTRTWREDAAVHTLYIIYTTLSDLLYFYAAGEKIFLKQPTVIFDPDAIVLEKSHRTERDSGIPRLQSPTSIELPEREEGEGEETPTFSHWGAPRVVEIWREPQVSLGISIVGGQTIIKRLKNGEELKGIFIKQVLEDSPAGKTQALKTGDKILEVSGVDLRNATHEEAVEAIKNGGNPVVFVIQSLSAAPRSVSPVLAGPPPPMKLPPPYTESSSPDSSRFESDVETDEKIRQRYADLSGDLLIVELEKEKNGLGLSLAGNKDRSRMSIFIVAIHPDGPAGRDGRIQVGDELLEERQRVFISDIVKGGAADYDRRLMQGDQILSVNGEDVRNASQEVVATVLKLVSQLKQSTGSSKIPYSPQDISFGTSPPYIVPEPEISSHRNVPSPLYFDPATCPIIPGQEMTIEISKGHSGLGLSIVGGKDTPLEAVVIHEVYEEGAAARDGRLWAGDQILEVNGIDLRNASHEDAITALRQTPQKVQLVVYRDEAQYKDEENLDIFHVELQKKSGRGLGLSIVGKRNGSGVFISDIVKGGAADYDRRLMQGDQILSVNGEDVRNVVVLVLFHLVNQLKQSTGSSKIPYSPQDISFGTSPPYIVPEPEISSHKMTIEISKGHSGLGLSIVGGKDTPLEAVVIHEVYEEGAAARDGRLWAGDQILEVVADTNISAIANQLESMSLCQNISSEHQTEEGESPVPKMIHLEKGPDGLGFSIVGGYGSPHGDLPIYVKTIFSK